VCVAGNVANGHQMTQQHCQSNRNKWSQLQWRPSSMSIFFAFPAGLFVLPAILCKFFSSTSPACNRDGRVFAVVATLLIWSVGDSAFLCPLSLCPQSNSMRSVFPQSWRCHTVHVKRLWLQLPSSGKACTYVHVNLWQTRKCEPTTNYYKLPTMAMPTLTLTSMAGNARVDYEMRLIKSPNWSLGQDQVTVVPHNCCRWQLLT